MSQMIDRLKASLAEALKHQQDALKNFQVVQAEYQAVTAEVVGYQKVIEIETRKELERVPEALSTKVGTKPQSQSEVNKTQLIKDTLGNKPGMTPADVWRALRSQIKQRNYVYAVLKRLKDRKQVRLYRGKYYPAITKNEEVETQGSVVQMKTASG